MDYEFPDLSAKPKAEAKPAGRRKPAQDEAFSAEEMGANGAEIRKFIERIEKLEEEKAALQDDIKDIIAELKGRGYDVKAVRAIIRLRKQDPDERQEAEAILDMYMQAIGMV